jgi:hypothetical protein
MNRDKREYQKPGRTFENSGAVNPRLSYYVPLENVTNTKNQDMKTMVDLGRYFSIFAPRQSGKTTFLKRIRSQLHGDPTYVVIMLSFQEYKKLDKRQFYAQPGKNLYTQLPDRLKEVKCDRTDAVLQLLERHHLSDHLSLSGLFEKLNRLIKVKKIIIFIDEFDGIPIGQLEEFLTALRDLYQDYKELEQKALYSVGLIGIRNITKLVVGGVSPFNIADQVVLPSFSLTNVRDLYAQYTAETNQPFTEEAVLYKETFVKIVFDHVKYKPNDKEQSWLEQYGLIKKKECRPITFIKRGLSIHFSAKPIYRKTFPGQDMFCPVINLTWKKLSWILSSTLRKLG